MRVMLLDESKTSMGKCISESVGFQMDSDNVEVNVVLEAQGEDLSEENLCRGVAY